MASLDADDTVVARAGESAPDEKTVATRRKRADSSDTVVAHRDPQPDDSTVVSRHGRRVRIDAAPAAEAIVEETLASDTVASLESGRDRTRKVVRGTARAARTTSLGAPGVLAEGRVATKPGKHVDRYPVRVAVPESVAIVRQVVLAPVVEERRNGDAFAIAQLLAKKRQAQAVVVLLSIVAATLTAALLVVLVIAVLSRL